MRLSIRSIRDLAASIGGIGWFLRKAGYEQGQRISPATLTTEAQAETVPASETAMAGNATSAFRQENSVPQTPQYVEEMHGGDTGGSAPTFHFPGEEGAYEADDLVVTAFSRYAGVSLFLLTLALAVYIIS